MYSQGTRVIQVQVVDDIVRVEYQNLLESSTEFQSADLVIVADGSASQLRGLLQPHLKHTYAGYVAWRVQKIEERSRSTSSISSTPVLQVLFEN